MKRLAIVVEGATEQGFVQRVLAPHLSTFDAAVDVRGVLIGGRGGHLHPATLQREINNLFSSRFHTISTMFDLFHLRNDVPGRDLSLHGKQRAESIEAALSAVIGHTRFIPYLSIHDVEALTFADVDRLAAVIGVDDRARDVLAAAAVRGPEAINDDRPPAYVIESVFPRYAKLKSTIGVLALEQVGLHAMRDKCFHFAQWLLRLEEWARP